MLPGVRFCKQATVGISPCGVSSFGCSLVFEGLQNEVLILWSQLFDVFQEVLIYIAFLDAYTFDDCLSLEVFARLLRSKRQRSRGDGLLLVGWLPQPYGTVNHQT